MPETPLILAIGDSHAQFWTGQDKHGGEHLIPDVDVASVGPALAYNLPRLGTTVQGLERIERSIQVRVRQKTLADYLMFNFGEIDIRAHVVRRAIYQDISLFDAVQQVCDSYVVFIEKMLDYGKKVLVFGPPATQPDSCRANAHFPAAGCEIDRNMATALFHERMKAEAERGRFAFLSILRHLIVPGGRTHLDVLYDTTHMGQIVMPYALDEVERVTGRRLNNPSGYVKEIEPQDPLVLDGVYERPILTDIAPNLAERSGGVLDFLGVRAVREVQAPADIDIVFTSDGFEFKPPAELQATREVDGATQTIRFAKPTMLRAMQGTRSLPLSDIRVISASYGGDREPPRPLNGADGSERARLSLTPVQVAELRRAHALAVERRAEERAAAARKRAERDRHHEARNAILAESAARVAELRRARALTAERRAEESAAAERRRAERDQHQQARDAVLAESAARVAELRRAGALTAERRAEESAAAERRRAERDKHHQARDAVLAERVEAVRHRAAAMAEREARLTQARAQHSKTSKPPK